MATYIVRFITEELKAGLKRANIARGKDNVISLSIFGGKKKEFEGAAGVKAEKTKTVFLGVGPTVQTSIAVYADVLYMDDSRQKAPVPAAPFLLSAPLPFPSPAKSQNPAPPFPILQQSLSLSAAALPFLRKQQSAAQSPKPRIPHIHVFSSYMPSFLS